MQHNQGDIAYTSLQTKIPERTLREWRRLAYLRGDLPPLPPSPPPPSSAAKDIPEFEDDAEALMYARQQIIDEIVSMTSSLKSTIAAASPYHRMLALTLLLDRLGKLDEYIPTQETDHVWRVEYVYDGSVHNVPPWADASDEDESDDTNDAGTYYDSGLIED